MKAPYLQSNDLSTTVTTDSSKIDALIKESDVAILTVKFLHDKKNPIEGLSWRRAGLS